MILKTAVLSANAALGFALVGTGTGEFPDLTQLNLTLDKIAYILSIVASIYSLYLSRKNGKQKKKGGT